MKAIGRLYIYLDSQNIRPTVFEREIGLSSGYLSNMKKRNADIGESVLNKVIDNCHLLSVEWLLAGKGGMLKDVELLKDNTIAEDPLSTYIKCELCTEKDKVIAAQQSQIETQAEYIELLKKK